MQDIFPLGTCEAHGGLLQPPLGYTRNVSTWPGFLQRTLRNANCANSNCFYQVLLLLFTSVHYLF